MQGDVSGIQMRLCIAGAAPLYSGPMRGGCGGAVPAPRRAGTARPGAAPHRQRLGSILGIAGDHMSLAFQLRSLVSHFGRHPAPCAQPIPAALAARAAPGDGTGARSSAHRDAALRSSFVFSGLITRGTRSFCFCGLFFFFPQYIFLLVFSLLPLVKKPGFLWMLRISSL